MKQLIALGIGTMITLGAYAEAASNKSSSKGIPVSPSAKAQAEKILKRGKVAEAKSSQIKMAKVEQATSSEQMAGDDSQIVLDMPDKKKTMRRRLLFSFGLFGMGVRFGWNKPKQEIITKDGEPTVKSKGVGSPIMTFSVGRKELGLGADNIPPEMRSKLSKADKEKASEAEKAEGAEISGKTGSF